MLAAQHLLLLLCFSICTLSVDNFLFVISGFAEILMQEHQRYLRYNKAVSLWHAKMTGIL